MTCDPHRLRPCWPATVLLLHGSASGAYTVNMHEFYEIATRVLMVVVSIGGLIRATIFGTCVVVLGIVLLWIAARRN